VVDYVLVAAALGLLVAAAAFGRRQLWRALVRFFTEPGYALDLAVFRIAICVAFLIGLGDLGGLYGFTTLPKGLEFAPVGLGWLVPHLPLDSSTVHIAYRAFEAAVILTAFGVFTRWAAAAMAVLGAYLFLIPNIFGYVDHGEPHLVWFSVLLAASPSGDALSFDALRRAWSAPHRVLASRERALRYALPLRFAWLMIGLIYIFPGTHKFFSAGLRWASSTNLIRRVYWQSFSGTGWPVAYQLDRHPLLMTLGGLGTLGFEMTFLLLILFRQTRYLAAVGGIFFHTMTKILLHIWFLTLQLAYVSFVPWQRILAWVGQRRVGSQLQLRYDPANAAAARIAALAAATDVLRTVEIVADPTATLVVSADERRWVGPDAVRRLARRLPALALLAPVLRSPVAVAHNPEHLASALDRPLGGRVGDSGGLVALTLVASCLTAAVLAAGLASARNGWPFAMYPTFAGYVRATVPTLGATALRCNHASFALDPRKAADTAIADSRYAGLVRHLIGPMTVKERRMTLSAFTQRFLDPAALAQSGVAAVEFTRNEVLLTRPPMASTPLSQARLVTIPIRPCS
jgi:hypothetical protein